jgi:hypothetical protein
VGRARVGECAAWGQEAEPEVDEGGAQLADKPMARIPGACGRWADTAGAYRMLSNDSFDWRDVLEPHAHCTMARMAHESVVLCLQDTTELKFNLETAVGRTQVRCFWNPWQGAIFIGTTRLSSVQRAQNPWQ